MLAARFIRRVNRLLNRRSRKNKVFCIGLHKTGTTTLTSFFDSHGYDSIHSTDWINNPAVLENNDFFADGGSHYDNINEFDFEKLYKIFPNSKFILQTRDTEKWVISKLKHAGWNDHTLIERDNLEEFDHNYWTHKSLENIERFIRHKINYEIKARTFFITNDKSRFLEIDITSMGTQQSELLILRKFLRLKSINRIPLPHSNMVRANVSLPEQALKAIKETISAAHVYRRVW